MATLITSTKLISACWCMYRLHPFIPYGVLWSCLVSLRHRGNKDYEIVYDNIDSDGSHYVLIKYIEKENTKDRNRYLDVG